MTTHFWSAHGRMVCPVLAGSMRGLLTDIDACKADVMMAMAWGWDRASFLKLRWVPVSHKCGDMHPAHRLSAGGAEGA